MSAWRLAASLVQLRGQVNNTAPDRSKVSDGTIGDPSHSARASAHNPDANGVVRAWDCSHDPGGGLDGHALAQTLLDRQDPRLRLVISRGRIGSGPAGVRPGQWRPYSGVNPHDRHVHIEVVAGTAGDRTGSWTLARPDTEDEVTNAEMDEIADRVWNRRRTHAGLQDQPPVAVLADIQRLNDKLDRLTDSVNALAAK